MTTHQAIIEDTMYGRNISIIQSSRPEVAEGDLAQVGTALYALGGYVGWVIIKGRKRWLYEVGERQAVPAAQVEHLGTVTRDDMRRLAADARRAPRGAYGAWDRDEAYADAPESGWER